MWQKHNHMWSWYYVMWGWYHKMWEKNKWTIEYDKRIVICDVGTAQFEDSTIKYEKKIKEPSNVTKI